MTAEEKANIVSKIFNKTDLSSVNALLANTGDTWDNLQQSITNSGGATQQMADPQLDNLQGQIIVNDFFVLSTCLAGEILQKFINYGVRFAIYGDFTKYTSKPLKDFMYESNKGKDIYFQPTVSCAVDKLSGCEKAQK